MSLALRLIIFALTMAALVMPALASCACGPGSSPGQDARGNVTNNGQTGFAYDFANQPTALTGTGAAAYVYDGNLKRVKEVRAGKTIYTVYSRVTGGLIYRDEVTDAIKTDYVNAGGAAIRLIKTGTGSAVPDYSHFDAQGSVVADTRTQGVVLWRESYEPFGRSRINPAANADDTGYTGHLRDSASGLVYMQARYYDPLIGRFLSTDPIGYQDQLNLYAYVANDPVNATDPTGEQSVEQLQAFVQGFMESHSLSGPQDLPAEDAFGNDPVSSDFRSGHEAGVKIGTALAAAKGVAALKKDAAKAGAKAERSKNVAKGIPESKLGPSGKPKQHTVEHSSRKEAQQAAKREADKAGGKVRNDANPANPEQGPHFQAEDAKGENVKPVVHHEFPD